MLQAAYAVRRANGELAFVLLASLDLEKYMQSLARSLSREGGVIAIIDGKGTILTWHPDGETLRATSMAESTLFEFARESQGGDAREFTGVGGVSRIWAASGLAEFPEAGLHVLVGVSKTDLLAAANRNLGQALSILAMASLLVFGGAWALVELAIRRQSARIISAAARFSVKDARELRYVRLNRAFEDLVGYPRSEMLGKTQQDFFGAEEVAFFTAKEREAIARLTLIDIPEALVETATRGVRIVHSQKLPILDEHGVPHYVLTIGEDITERKAVERAFSASKLEAERANQAKSNFLSRMSHDLRLNQILMNLLSNAVKYNREGGRVQVTYDDLPEGRIRVKVTDTGAGIPPEQLMLLFQPFERLGAAQSAVEGTGLGLALSKALAEAMGGALGVTSEVGRGSTFWVELARVEAPAEAAVRAHPEASAPDSGVTGTVLYIEDNLSNQKLMERLLARRPGVRLIVAANGQAGLDLARADRPHLILLDLHLPDLPGEEVLRRLWEDARTRAIPVAVLSADATPSKMRRLLAAGARAYLTKPLDINQVLRLLDDRLEEHS